jgi:Protein of unknown function (DUF2924)
MKHRSYASDQKALSEELAALSEDTVKSLKVRWRALWNSEPPKRISRELLMRAIAHRMQERRFGSLKPATVRLLERMAKGGTFLQASQTSRTRATPGTVLVREWQGVSHRVTVLDDGAVYHGRHFRSLSEVARAITGARWSGPLFFGLRRPGSEAASD